MHLILVASKGANLFDFIYIEQLFRTLRGPLFFFFSIHCFNLCIVTMHI